MRNPDRIDPVIEELRAFWKDHPDWRLGQVLVNAMRWGPAEVADPFYLEDDALLTGLQALATERL